MYKISVFIFTRDYRLTDNRGLIKALEQSTVVIPIFIFTPEQITRNPYKSNNAVQFMIESLDDLDGQLMKLSQPGKPKRLHRFYGDTCTVLNRLIRKLQINAVFINRDYTPYARTREQRINDLCAGLGIAFEAHEDALLFPIDDPIRFTGGGTMYTKFTPFWNKVKIHFGKKYTEITNTIRKNYITGHHIDEMEITPAQTHKIFYKPNPNIACHGGRAAAIKQCKKGAHMSAYIKFGCMSIREVFAQNKSLLRQLVWREFYTGIAYAYPITLSDVWKERCFRSSYNNIPWITYKTATDKQKRRWKAWCEGKTGFPIVDANMRELNATGFMNNRGRLVVASFLIKTMFWSPHEGERYFSEKLVDIDRAINSSGGGNWAWVSGGGTDIMPYFRVFNPWIQSQKNDPDATYIKKWIPELATVPAKYIHKWYDNHQNYPAAIYAAPMLNYKIETKKSLKRYKNYLSLSRDN